MRYAFFRSSERLTRFVEGEYVDDGKARRMGHEFEVGVGPWHGVEVFTALTLHDAQYRGGENGGNNVTDVPRYIWKVGAQAESHWGTGARAFYNDVGRWDTHPENDHSYAGYRVVDAGVYQRISGDWTAARDIKNLLDETYAEYVSYWSDANQYISANPRTFFATLSYSVE